MMRASARLNSCIVGIRRAGVFVSALATSDARSGPTSGHSDRIGRGSSCRILVKMSGKEVSAKGTCPVSISYRITPSE